MEIIKLIIEVESFYYMRVNDRGISMCSYYGNPSIDLNINTNVVHADSSSISRLCVNKARPCSKLLYNIDSLVSSFRSAQSSWDGILTGIIHFMGLVMIRAIYF